MGLVKEFKEFALRGNVMDMAVGIIIGAAFGKIVSSMVADVVMPMVGIFGKADFSNLYVPLTSAAAEKIDAKAAAEGLEVLPIAEARGLGPVFAYGNFLTEVLNFIIVAFAIFIMIKMVNTARKRFERQQEEAPKGPPELSTQEKLLVEIRDAVQAKG